MLVAETQGMGNLEAAHDSESAHTTALLLCASQSQGRERAVAAAAGCSGVHSG